MNPRLDLLQPYPFERLRQLLSDLKAGNTPINLGIGEPQHPTPDVVTRALTEAMPLLGKYPPTGGTPELRNSIASWHRRRYGIELSPEREVIPVAGSREALFAFAQAVVDPMDPGVVLLPNPFYQIYEGAAIMAGARPFFVPLNDRGLMDWTSVPEDVWPHVRLVYVCSPGNPSGAVMSREDWGELFALADRYPFIIAADECYSEIYNGEPPIGALQAADALGRSRARIVSFNSLSKRSSCPGLRSGFVAGDETLLKRFLLYRTYQGCAPSLVVQHASVAAWDDEAHVEENRAKYRAKFEIARQILPSAVIPAGGFFLWQPVEDDEATARRAFAEAGVTVLPGCYLAREFQGRDPGAGFMRIALVAEAETIEQALLRLRPLL